MRCIGAYLILPVLLAALSPETAAEHMLDARFIMFAPAPSVNGATFRSNLKVLD